MFENKTYENIKSDMLNNANLDIAKNEGSVINSLVSATALSHAGIYTVLDTLLNMAFIRDSYAEYLDSRVNEFGVFRKKGELACGYITIQGNNNIVIEDGTKFISNGLTYTMQQSGDTPHKIEDGSVTVFIQADDIGKKYNLPAQSTFEFVNNTNGIESIKNSIALEGGTDDESDEELKERFFFLQQNKGSSGNEADYINWGNSVSGVKNTRVISRWNGINSVKVIVMGDNNQNVDSRVLQNAKTYILSRKPLVADVTVVTPSPVEINISATVEINDNADLETIKGLLKNDVNNYLIKTTEVTYTKVAGLLSAIDGVIDFSDLRINGNSRNIKLSSEQVGTVNNIELTKGVVD